MSDKNLSCKKEPVEVSYLKIIEGNKYGINSVIGDMCVCLTVIQLFGPCKKAKKEARRIITGISELAHIKQRKPKKRFKPTVI